MVILVVLELSQNIQLRFDLVKVHRRVLHLLLTRNLLLLLLLLLLRILLLLLLLLMLLQSRKE